MVSNYNYMLLGRFKMDLEYFWGCGQQSEKCLFWGSYDKHIRETIEQWKKLPQKPTWLRAKDLIEYKNRLS